MEIKNNNYAVLFDMDGITIDTEPLYLQAEINLFKEYNVEIPKEDWSLFQGSSEKQFYELSMKRYDINEDENIFIIKGRKYVRMEFDKGIPFMSGFKKLYNRISPHFLMGLVTASPRHSLNKIIKQLELSKYFSHILSGEETNYNKPFPDPYLEMMRLLKVFPKNTIILEDSLTGLQSALSSGAKVIAKTGSVPRNKLFNAHYIIDHLDEITITLLEDILHKK